MSLTTHLRASNSPVKKFILEQFPNTTPFLADARREIAAAQTLRPAPGTGFPWATIGQAIDYRIRYYFDVTPVEHLVAYKGARRITDRQPVRKSPKLDFQWTGKGDSPIIIFDKGTGRLLYTFHPARAAVLAGLLFPQQAALVDDARPTNFSVGTGATGVSLSANDEPVFFANQVLSEGSASSSDARPLKREYRSFFKSLDKFTNQWEPKARRLTAESEDTLNKYCVVLAVLEQVVRAGLETTSPLATGKFRGVNALLSLAEPLWLDDMRRLSWRFYDGFSHLLELPHILNPIFDGSHDVGGADADLIVDGTLIDIKTSVKPVINADYIWQLLGYTLLDYSDRYHIDSIGLYMSRQGILFKWDLAAAIADLCPGHPLSIAELRAKFQELIDAPQQSLMLRRELLHLLPA